MNLTDDIVLHASTFLTYGDVIGGRSGGLVSVNKYFNNMFKTSPKIIKRRIKLQEKIIDSFLYHRFSNTRAFEERRQDWKPEPIPKIDNYLNIPRGILLSVKPPYVSQISDAQKRIREENRKLDKLTVFS